MVGNAKKLRCSEWFLEPGQPIDHFVEAHASVSSAGCERLRLRATVGGQAIRLGTEVITAANAWAHVAELSAIAGAISVRGAVVIDGADESEAVDPGLVQALACIMNVGVIAAVTAAAEASIDAGDTPESASAPRPASTPSAATLTPRDHHSVAFDPRRPMQDPGPSAAAAGTVVKHVFDLTSITHEAEREDRSMVVELGQRLRGNESLLGQNGDVFWRPVLINTDDANADAIPLAVMRGDQSGTVDLAATLGFDLAVVDAGTGADFYLHCPPERRRQIADGAWHVLVYSRVVDGIVPLVRPAPAPVSTVAKALPQRRPSISRRQERLPLSQRRQRPSIVRTGPAHHGPAHHGPARIDGPHNAGPAIERPHRSQASRPANYSQVLRAHHRARQPSVSPPPHKTSAARHE